MPVTRKTIGPIIGTGADAVIMPTTTVLCRLTHYHLCNTSGSPQNAAVALNGSTATAANCIVAPAHQIPGAGIGTGDEDRFCSHMIPIGGSVHANLATAVTLTLDYEEITAG